jgi:hypothetical protein
MFGWGGNAEEEQVVRVRAVAVATAAAAVRRSDVGELHVLALFSNSASGFLDQERRPISCVAKSLACFGRTAKPVHAASSHTPAARLRIARAASRLESLGAPVVCLLLFLQGQGVPAPPPPAQKKFPNFTPFCIQPHGRRIRPARRLPLARQRRHRGEHNLRRRSRALQQAAGGQCCQ